MSLRYCLDAARITAADLTIAVSANQRSAALAENDLTLNPDLRFAPNLRRMTVTHHLAHAASVVACSGFETCAVLVCDGVGSPVTDLDLEARSCVAGAVEGASEHLTLYHSVGPRITPLEVHACRDWVEKTESGMWRFHSLGGLYSAVAQQIFGSPNDAGKVMGLAPYGRPRFAPGEFLVIENGQLRFTNEIQRHFQESVRWPECAEKYRDLAASAQAVIESTLLHFVRHLRARTRQRHLCLAGGVALNSVANERILREGGFEDVFVIPAADDSGTAIGAAFLGHWASGGNFDTERARSDSHGHAAAESEILSAVEQIRDLVVHRPNDLLSEVATRLRRGEIGGWMRGGAEFGPRALGQRSVIASPLGTDTKDRVNAEIKFRESFRPFAPSILAEQSAAWFAFETTPAESPFMLRVVRFHPDRAREVPAVAHVDGTGRLQILTRRDNGLFYDLIERFFQMTGVPILLNTSMNLRDEPIVESPEDALWMMLGTNLNFCVIGDCLVTKRDGVRPILDYVPVVVASDWRIRLGIKGGRLDRMIDAEDAVQLSCETPWGRSDLTLPPRLLPVLSVIDGVSDGHGLRRKLMDGSQESPYEGRLNHDLLLLRRMKVVRLRVPE